MWVCVCLCVIDIRHRKSVLSQTRWSQNIWQILINGSTGTEKQTRMTKSLFSFIYILLVWLIGAWDESLNGPLLPSECNQIHLDYQSVSMGWRKLWPCPVLKSTRLKKTKKPSEIRRLSVLCLLDRSRRWESGFVPSESLIFVSKHRLHQHAHLSARTPCDLWLMNGEWKPMMPIGVSVARASSLLQRPKSRVMGRLLQDLVPAQWQTFSNHQISITSLSVMSSRPISK